MRTAAQAVAYARSATRNTPNSCARFMSECYGWPPVKTPCQTAMDLWNYSTDRHANDWNVPAGGIAILGPRAKRGGNDTAFIASAGDAFLSIGGGWFIGSDQPVYGAPGLCTIASREALTGRHYVGWVGNIWGNPIDFGNTRATTPNKSVTTVKDMVMYWARKASNGNICVIFPWMENGKGAYRNLTGPEWQAAAVNGAKYVNLNDADWNALTSRLTAVV